MSDKQLILTLAKVIIAAAWADGRISSREMSCIKDLLYRLPHASIEPPISISADDWTMLEMYIEIPISGEERQRLVKELHEQIHTAHDKQLVLDALANLIRADGEMTNEELKLAEEVEKAITAVDVTVTARMGRLIKGAVQRRSDAVAKTPFHNGAFADYVRNRVFHAVQQRLNLTNEDLGIAEDELRKLSLAGGLMAKIAHTDRVVTYEEFQKMTAVLQKHWQIEKRAATFITEVAIAKICSDLDYYRMTRQFFTATTETQRLQFIHILFAIAQADGEIALDESETVRRIAVTLNINQESFISAKKQSSLPPITNEPTIA